MAWHSASAAPDRTKAMRDLRGKIARGRFLVIGDLMLDHYLWGDATRISPEAPVPVVKAERDTITAGGAANVAFNLAALGATDVAVDSDISTRTTCKVGTVVGVTTVKDWEHVFPMILFLGALKCCDDKHQDLGTHTNRQEQVAHGEVQYFE